MWEASALCLVTEKMRERTEKGFRIEEVERFV